MEIIQPRNIKEEYNANYKFTKEEQKTEKILRKGFGYEPADYGDDLSEDIEQFAKDHKKNKLLIQEILEGYEKSRNNDMVLYFEFLKTKFPEISVTSGKDHIIFKFPRNLIKFFPSPETSSRSRRALNKEGIGLPTNPEVIRRRSKREKVIRKYFQNIKQERIAKP